MADECKVPARCNEGWALVCTPHQPVSQVCPFRFQRLHISADVCSAKGGQRYRLQPLYVFSRAWQQQSISTYVYNF